MIGQKSLFMALAALVIFSISMTFTGCFSSKQSPPATATNVDISLYAGRWHEIARLPMPFQKVNEAAIAVYTPLPNGMLSVHNIAVRPDGSQHDIYGYAEVLNPPANTKLAVRFNTWFSPFIPIPKEGNYWIFYVENNYHEAIVGTPDRKYLWILARTAKLQPQVIQDLLQKAVKLGFDGSKVLFDP